MKINLLITLILLVVLAACNSGKKTNPNAEKITVATYYFANYHTGDPRNIINKGAGWSEWELVKAAQPRFPGHQQPKVPLWGYLDEKDPKVMSKKIDAAADHGIDCFIFDWYMYEDGPFLNRCIDEGFLKAKNCDRIKFGLMWANHDWVDIHPYTRGAAQKLLYPGKVSPKRFDEICDFVIKEYFTKPNYWKIDGKAYFSMYDVQKFVEGFGSMEATKAAMNRMRQHIADTENRTGKKVFVGFNVRHMNDSMEMKKILLSGELGKIIAIEYQEHLNTSHGASYFRRWNGKMKYSGSLLLHKASHHFDLVNWLLDSEPLDVQAIGKLAFYGHNNSYRGRNCRTCPFTQKCKYYWNMSQDSTAMALFGNCEDVDGYYRDGCVWDNEIDIYDTSSVLVNYDNGTQLTYTMNTFLPFEGQLICFSGENGRLEVRINYQQPWKVEGETEFRLTKDMETTKFWTIQASTGGHGGADERLKDTIFLSDTPDPLGSKAGSYAGIMSSLVGIAARQSIETGQKVKITDLVTFPNT